jgi:alcohol dehydrogenase YqhD (iron-dependent ADH family)
MNNFNFFNPTKIIFGKDTIGEIGKEISARSINRVLLLYGRRSIFKNGVYDTVIKSLKENGVEYVELGGVKPNPVLSKILEAIDLARKENVDAILGVGGGSVIDSAKVIAAGCLYEGDIWQAFEGKTNLDKSLPIFSVLTLSATASEMNAFAVVTKEDEKKKWPFSAGDSSYPTVSIIDPSVQATLPAEQTVNGAVDAIAHVLELYFDGTDNTDLQDELAEGMIRNIMTHARILIDDPENYNSRAELAWTATLALNGLNGAGRNGGDWATHMLEHSLSAYFDIAHGAGLAIVMPAWMKYVYTEKPERFAKFADSIFGINNGSPEKSAIEGIEKLKSFFSEIGAPVSLKDVDIPENMISELAANAALRSPFGTLKKIEHEDAREIFQMAYS